MLQDQAQRNRENNGLSALSRGSGFNGSCAGGAVTLAAINVLGHDFRSRKNGMNVRALPRRR